MDAQLDRFYRAWCAPELELLGFRLTQPYCLGMALQLEAVESPFVRLHDDPELMPRDLLVALSICANAAWPYRAPRITCDSALAKRLERDKPAFTAAAGAFIAWLSECSGRPEYWQEEGEETTGTLTAPTVLAQAVMLLRGMHGLTEQRVWSMPLGLISWYHGALTEQEGAGLRFFYDSEAAEEANPEDLDSLSDEQLFEVVKRDRGEAFAFEFMAQRAARKEAPHAD